MPKTFTDAEMQSAQKLVAEIKAVLIDCRIYIRLSEKNAEASSFLKASALLKRIDEIIGEKNENVQC